MTAPAVSHHVGFDISDGVAVLELRRPDKRNALSRDMLETILTHLDAAAGRPDVRVLVVQGGTGVFCAGADLAAVKERDGSASASFRELVVRTVTAIAEFPVPSVASVDGPCVGAGCSLALACDIRFAHPNASFAIPAVRHGIVYDEDSIARLATLVGPSRAARMLYTGLRLDGTQAERIGLVDECSHDLDRLVGDCVGVLAAADPSTVAAHRNLLRATRTAN
ncbi:MAG TPA: enoyl-CoA hydratase/isomerase family protein [Mycobacterium sp.]|nr:enoyl-CoA hydratase/isomerase family protein [Mycobacterium sp.]